MLEVQLQAETYTSFFPFFLSQALLRQTDLKETRQGLKKKKVWGAQICCWFYNNMLHLALYMRCAWVRVSGIIGRSGFPAWNHTVTDRQEC